jgi:Tfp pilus assembly protein PilZ
MVIEQRQFIRHPAEVPLQIFKNPETSSNQTGDISEGGLSFTSTQAYNVGETVQVRISICEPAFSASGVIRWCKEKDNTVMVGVSFVDKSEAYTLRMVEQICHVESYRQHLLNTKGINLSSEQAAIEWVKHNAAKFKQSFY